MAHAWTCDDCGQKLRGHWAHCGICCKTFGGVEGFDMHLVSLVDAGCKTEAQIARMKTKSGTPRLAVKKIDGVKVWSKPYQGPRVGLATLVHA